MDELLAFTPTEADRRHIAEIIARIDDVNTPQDAIRWALANALPSTPPFRGAVDDSFKFKYVPLRPGRHRTIEVPKTGGSGDLYKVDAAAMKTGQCTLVFDKATLCRIIEPDQNKEKSAPLAP